MKRSFLLMMVVFSIVSLPAFSQKTIKGKIVDQNGSPVPFATITIKNIITLADQYGVFDARVAAYPSSVTVTAIGFDKLLFKTGFDSILNITLQSKRGTELESVVVTGLGQAVTHGISHYSTSQANVRGLSAANNALSGKVAGVSVRSSNYIPAQGQPQWMVKENGFHTVTRDPLSTFSIDVDPASYSHLRRMLNEGYRPPAEAVRIEEMINYFKYNYPQPTGADPFSINTETSSCPWNPKHKLLLIGMQGKKIPVENLPASNLVFLIDVSGSMMSEDKLGLVKSSLSLLTDQLRKQDKISIVVYAGAAGLVLEPTNGDQKKMIKDALNNLEAGGSTAGGAGLKLAYDVAKKHFIKQGNNRVILCTDGDFNVGPSSDEAVVSLIEKERTSGVYLTVLGYGTGNYQDDKMQQLADKGNGNHAYVDNLSEAKKVLVNEFGGTMFTIAGDVKLQLEFNPAKVAGYRLIGYENRMLENEDFNDDKKDAGEMGSNHTVTALYEIIPAGVKSKLLKTVDSLKYQPEAGFGRVDNFSTEMVTIKFRYKNPGSDSSKLMVYPVDNATKLFNKASDNFRFATAVAGFGMLLRNSEFKGNMSYDQVIETATAALGKDQEGYRSEFIALVTKASELEVE